MFHQDTIQCHGVSYRQIVLIFTPNTLRDPEDDSRKHECDILRDVRIAIVGVLLRVLLEHIFEDQDRLVNVFLNRQYKIHILDQYVPRYPQVRLP